MGLIYDSGDSAQFMSGLNAIINNMRMAVDSFNQACNYLTSTVGTFGMQGKAYEAGGDLFAGTIQPVLQDLNFVLDDLSTDLMTYSGADPEVAQYGYLDEEMLNQVLTSLKQEKVLYESVILISPSSLKRTFETSLNHINSAIKKAEDELQALHDFDNITSGLFQSADRSLNSLAAVVGALMGSSINPDGTIKMSVKFKAAYAKFDNDVLMAGSINQVVEKVLEKGSASDKQTLREQLKAEVKDLRLDGWDRAAIKAYLAYLGRYTLKDAQSDQVTPQQKIKSYWRSVHNVGSKIYTSLFNASRLKPYAKLNLLLNRQLGGYIDQNGFLQLPANRKYHLKAQISPTSSFFPAMRDTVVAAYKNNSKGLKEDSLGQELHLFRSYLDRSYLNYIRQYDGLKHDLPAEATDYQRLQ